MSPTAAFLQGLQQGLATVLHGELIYTMRVAVLTAAGVPAQQLKAELAKHHPDSDDTDLKAARKRLTRVAEGWTL